MIVSKPSKREERNPYRLQSILQRFEKPRELTTQDPQRENNNLKQEVQALRSETRSESYMLRQEILKLQEKMPEQREMMQPNLDEHDFQSSFVGAITTSQYQIWYALITLIIYDFKITLKALIDTGADQNCIQEGLIPIKYFEKTTEGLRGANNNRLKINYKLSKVHVCNDEICFVNSFIRVKDFGQELILGTSFITQLYLFKQGVKLEALGKR